MAASPRGTEGVQSEPQARPPTCRTRFPPTRCEAPRALKSTRSSKDCKRSYLVPRRKTLKAICCIRPPFGRRSPRARGFSRPRLMGRSLRWVGVPSLRNKIEGTMKAVGEPSTPQDISSGRTWGSLVVVVGTRVTSSEVAGSNATTRRAMQAETFARDGSVLWVTLLK